MSKFIATSIWIINIINNKNGISWSEISRYIAIQEFQSIIPLLNNKIK